MKTITKSLTDFYYILVVEWNYPTESGRDTLDVTFDGDELNECLDFAKGICEDERDNFFENTKEDPLQPNELKNEGGYIITSKSGLDDFYYAVRIVTMKKLDKEC